MLCRFFSSSLSRFITPRPNHLVPPPPFSDSSRAPPRPARRSSFPQPPHLSPFPKAVVYDPASLRARYIPFSLPGMSWNAVLEGYARMRDPERELPKGVLLGCDERTLTIYDGFEKAKYHFLIMPRDPFPLEKGGNVKSSELGSLGKLLKSEDRMEVVKALERQAEEVKEMIEDEMQKEEGFVWPVQIGFHAAESMKHVHLHVISTDLISPKLKNKKHYNSFHPTLGFFLHLSDVILGCESSSFSLDSPKHYDSLLKLDLVSFHNGETYPNIPKLKKHLEEEWERMRREGRRVAKLAMEKAEGKGEEGEREGEREGKRQKLGE
ncbi:hypothetical protein JCM8547_001890 [Rhodosporidiobolus lusitaniae]